MSDPCPRGNSWCRSGNLCRDCLEERQERAQARVQALIEPGKTEPAKRARGLVRVRSTGAGQDTIVSVVDGQGRDVPLNGVQSVQWSVTGRHGRGRLVIEIEAPELELDLLPEDVVVIPQPKDIPF